MLTERTRKQLEKARPIPSTRHVEAKTPGELVCLDCFYIGKLKGVGPVWQITACDAASSFALAQVFVGAPRARIIAEFLRQRVVPFFRKAGYPLQRVLTDRGSEFKGAFDEACRKLGIRHTRTKPRHAFTNGFVERLQQTILHEHWRISFAAAISRGSGSSMLPSKASCASTTTSERTMAIARAAARPLRLS